MLNVRFLTLAGMILVAAASRLIPHPPNFTPVGAMALFGGAYFASRRAAFAVPLAALLLSDLALAATRYGWSFFSTQPAVYVSFALIVCLGLLLRGPRSTPARAVSVGAASLAASTLFFLITNFAVWASGSMRELYDQTLAGLVKCYAAGIPYFANTVAGDLLYALLLFGGFALAETLCQPLRWSQSQPAAPGARVA